MCSPVTTGASLPLYEVVNTFTKGSNPDFGGTLPAFKLDPGVLSDLLTTDGAPVYAHGRGKTLTTSGAQHGLLPKGFGPPA